MNRNNLSHIEKMKIVKIEKEQTVTTSINIRPSQYQKLYDLSYPQSVSKYIRDWIDGLKPVKKNDRR